MPEVDRCAVGMLTFTEDDVGTVVRVRGDVDIVNADRIEDLLERLLQSGDDDVVLDLGAVEFMDSSGLHVLLAARARHPGRFHLGRTSPRVDRLLDITDTRVLLT
jgi:anti-anti-sigma factor